MPSTEITKVRDKDGRRYWTWFSILDTGQAWHGISRTRWGARISAARWRKGDANKSSLGVSLS